MPWVTSGQNGKSIVLVTCLVTWQEMCHMWQKAGREGSGRVACVPGKPAARHGPVLAGTESPVATIDIDTVTGILMGYYRYYGILKIQSRG
jgi:hypothetical protein